MLRDLPAARHRNGRVAIAGGFVLLALAGEWAGHAATWYLTGGATPGQALSGASHSYLGPVGALIAVLAAIVSWLVWRGLRRLVEAARSLEATIRRAWRLDARQAPPDVPAQAGAAPHGHRVRFTQVWAALAAVQLVVYLVQENLEAHATGHGWPVMHVLTAHHGSALAVHAAIALLGAALAVEVTEHWLERARAVTVAVAVYRALTWRRSSDPSDPSPHLPPAASPLLLVGRSIFSRPPPSLLSV